MMDNDRDGIIGEDDLASIYQTIGREADPKAIKEMLKESPDKLNFTHFLTLFGEKLHGTDSETALRDAFILFDEGKTGKLHEEYFKDLLQNVGDQYSKDEIKQVWKELPIEGGNIDYLKLVTIIKRGKEDE
jgi:myosin regulatory light chain 12